uniref:PDZ domain-containing protein n=1 Tax=Alexandrium monilatum TaxID=311494 RepID=A0A7S4T2N2_9DINO|mmetsp:Transcript_77575/g.231125  ORF Transcript_77575/g.231125 Transcript_77575/m.231125 type:complete len:236 (-) Transcript_77575:67-774(-)
MICCCVGGNDTAVGVELPMEPAPSKPKAMEKILSQPQATPLQAMIEEEWSQEEGEACRELFVGAVVVPGDTQQGLDVITLDTDDRVVVADVIEGKPWAEWNDSHPNHKCEPGDQVLSVNGQPLSFDVTRSLMHKSAKDRHISLFIRKPKENHVSFFKEKGAIMGLALVPTPGGLLFVEDVREAGLIDQWNKENPKRRVRPLDLITSVNGVSENQEEMVEALGMIGEMEIVLLTHN